MAKGKNKGSGTPSGAPATPAPAKPAAPKKEKNNLWMLAKTAFWIVGIVMVMNWMKGCTSGTPTPVVTDSSSSPVTATKPTTAQEVWRILGRTEENKPRIVPETYQEAKKVAEETGKPAAFTEMIEPGKKSKVFKTNFDDHFWRFSVGNVKLILDPGTPREKDILIDEDGKHTLKKKNGEVRTYEEANSLRVQYGSIQAENLGDEPLKFELFKK